MTDCLLDTSFLIDYFNEVAGDIMGPARRFRSALPARTKLFVSVVSIAELLEGAADADEVEQALDDLASTLGLHRQHARRAGLMQRRARATGTRLGENDAWIAATAALAQLKLVGNDDSAFAERPSVDYVNFR